MDSPSATFEVSESAFALSSSLGNSTLKWSAVSEVWVFDNLWLFLFSKSQFATIPLDNIPDEAKAFILAKIQASGGKVV